ncbi:MAG: lysophospholipase L1-like esterase [Flavobacteriaceae bacterium]|jgi:lysophospholipase L1-like esterase
MKRLTTLVVLIFSAIAAFAQNPLRFEEEVNQLTLRNSEIDIENPVLFVGSSSFRIWKNVADDLGDKRIVNNGFGGSHFSDLIYYMEELVFAYQPRAIFIYEGDNDFGDNKSIEETMRDAKSAYEMIRQKMPEVPVYFVSPKPSVLRAHLSESYIVFNQWLNYWVQDKPNTYFVDVWNPMMKTDGTLDESLFLEDNLHMNAKGYAIWTKVIKPIVGEID